MIKAGHCGTCGKRNTCRRLCAEAKEYTNQDVRKKNYHEIVTKSGEDWEIELHQNDANLSLAEMFGGIPELELPEWKIVLNTELTDQQSQCLYMYYWMNLSQEEIAKKLEISQQTVGVYVERAKKKISFYLKERKYILENIDNMDLTNKQKAVASLYYFRNMTQEEIALKLNISQPTICEHLSKIRSKLFE